jgi:hypothetical protein
VPQRLTRVLKEPLAHFLLASAAIYVAYLLLATGEDSADDRKIVVRAADIQVLANEYAQLWGRPPTREELEEAVRRHARTQAFYREALAMGLDEGDLAIERRLAQKVELLARSLITPPTPTDAELRDWYEANLDDYKQPDRYSLTQIFFDPDRRQAATLDDARAVLAELESIDGLPSSVEPYGDRIMLRNHYELTTELELRKVFGSGFVNQVLPLEPGKWHGPILSGYGTHLVWIDEVVISPPPDFEEVKAKVGDAWMAEQMDELSTRFVDELIAKYDIVVEETTVPIIGQSA